MRGKKTYSQEEFEDKFHAKYPDVIITGKYIGNREKIKYICPCCHDEHESIPQRLMNGHFCRKNIGNNNPRKKTLEQFKQEVKLIDSDVQIIGEYINANIPIEFICKCGRHDMKAPGQILLGHTKCKKCAYGRLSFEEIFQKISLLENGVILINDYDENDMFTKKECLNYTCSCGQKSRSSIKHLINGGKCASCSSPRIKDSDQFLDEMKIINPKMKILSRYDRVDKNIIFMCECGNIGCTTPHSLLKGARCAICAGNKKKTTEDFIKQMQKVNPIIKIIGEYINTETKIDYICECGEKHSSLPSLLLNGHRCGHCNMSKSEYATDYFLSSHKIDYEYDYIFDDCKNVKGLKFDFYLKDFNTCIELDGEHHFMPVNFRGINDKRALERHEYTKKMDLIKNNFCKENNIRLIRIPYYDFDKIDEILTEKLKKEEKKSK